MTPLTDPVHRDIWATVRAINDAWTRGDPEDLANYFHPDMVAITPSERHRLEGGPACVAAWKAFRSAARIDSWEEHDPAIRVHGDAAVVTYYYRTSFDLGGKTITAAGRDMFFLVRQQGRWWAVADQFSPYPA